MSVLNYREPFTLDWIVRALDKVPFSPPFLLLIPALTLLYDGQRGVPSVDVLRELLFTKYKWCGRAVVFILVKTISRFLSLIARNHWMVSADKPDWNKDVLVITGGATGIGAKIVELLQVKHKAQVAVLDIAQPTYPKTAGAPEPLYVRTDVTKSEDIAKAHEAIRARFGRSPSFVVSCAGIAIAGSLLQVSPESVEKTFQVNALSNVRLAREFLPPMLQANHGHYVTLASGASYYTPPMLSSYCMSKSTALAFHEELSVELRVVFKRPNIRTTICTPLKVKTLLGHSLRSSDQQFTNPDLDPIQVATAIVDALDSGRSQALLMPLLTSLLPFVRALPDYFRSIVTTVGKTDGAITPESIADGIRAGYGKNLRDLDPGLSKVFDEMTSTFGKSE